MLDLPTNSVSPDTVHTYDSDFFLPLFEIEDRHFWFRARNQIIATLTTQLTAGLPAGYRVLEVGCGTGNVLRVLQQHCPNGIVIGMDLFREGLWYARGRTTCPLVQADLRRPPFGSSFDIIGLFDVLEHMPDDRRALCDLRAMLKPGGSLLLTVPAHQSLWSYFDEASRHCRRYELADLESALLDTGYRLEYITYYMASLFLPVWVGRRAAAWLGRSQNDTAQKAHTLSIRELRVVPVVNQILAFVLTQESRLLAQRRTLPIGTSLLAIARRK